MLIAMQGLPYAQAKDEKAEGASNAANVLEFVRQIRDTLEKKEADRARMILMASKWDAWIVIESLARELAWDAAKFAADVYKDKVPDGAELASYVAWRRLHPMGSTLDGVSKVVSLQNKAMDPNVAPTERKRYERLLVAAEAAGAIRWFNRENTLLMRAQAIAQKSKPQLPYLPIVERRLTLAEAVGMDASKIWRYLDFLCREYSSRRQFEKANAYAARSLKLAADDDQRSKSLRRLVTLASKRGESTQVIRYVRALRALAARHKNAVGVAAADIKWAAADATLGRPNAAMARLEPALEILEAHGTKEHLRGGHLQAAMIAITSNDFERTLRHVARADAASKGLPYKDYRLRQFEAHSLWALGEQDEARRVLDELLERIPVHEREERAKTIAIQIMYANRATDVVENEARLAELRTLRANSTSSSAVAQLAFCDMKVAFQKGLHAEAIRAGKRARLHAERSVNPLDQIQIDYLLARAYVALGEYAHARRQIKVTLRLLTEYSESMPEQMGVTFREPLRSIPQLAADLASKQEDYEALFQIAERAFAVTLRGRVGEEATTQQALSKDDRDRLDELRAKESRAAKQLRISAIADAGKPIESRAGAPTPQVAWANVQDELERHRTAIRAKNVIAGQILYPVIDTFASAQKRLTAAEALLVLIRGTSVVHGLVITSQSVRYIDLGSADEFESAIRDLTLSDPLSDEKAEVERLHGLVANPVKLPPSVRHIAVMAQEGFSRVPYAAIWPTREVRMIPSATVDRLLNERADDGKGILALADPRAKDVPRLPGANREARTIGTTVLVEDKATEPSFNQALRSEPSWRSIHIACHAAMNNEHPLRSALILAPTKDSDGLYTVSELLGARINTDLAVLAACSAGQRSWMDFEGAMTFTHAFFVAGAKRVLVSLWDVNDAASSALLTKFYEFWTPKTSPATALTKAQAWMRTKKKWAHPAFWASWQLWGAR